MTIDPAVAPAVIWYLLTVSGMCLLGLCGSILRLWRRRGEHAAYNRRLASLKPLSAGRKPRP